MLVPHNFTSWLPRTLFVDGEFWFGRGRFACTYAFVQEALDFIQWHTIRIVSFDIASRDTRHKPFEARYKHLLDIIPEHPFNIIAARVKCKESAHLGLVVQSIIDDGGEGAILRSQGSLYESGRTPSLLKLKTTEGDKEAIVIGIEKDNSVQLKMTTGKAFTVPPQDVHIPKPSIGQVVTFSYERHTRRDLPVNPKIYRIRIDLAWEDVVHNSVKERKYLNERLHVEGFTTQPLNHWTAKNMRLFLELYAKSRNMDPLLPDTWYNTPSRAIRDVKGGNVVLDKLKGGYFHTLRSLFPEIELDETTFNRSRWKAIGHRRKFFEIYARENGFDPQNPENWYSQRKSKIMATKGARNVIFHHHNSLSSALLDLFPNIGFSKARLQVFKRMLRIYGFGCGRVVALWNAGSADRRRRFFENYATENGFDPYNPENWYLQSRAKLLSVEGTRRMILHHNNSLSQSLIDLFPNIGLRKERLWGYKPLWHDVDNRRNFFVNYAKEHGFDPYMPENWYAQPTDSIMSVKGARRVIFYHENSLSKALLDLFPNLGLKKSKLPRSTSLWNEMENRRKFFENYAKENGFNPHNPENWYSQSRDMIVNVKGARRVLFYHNNSVPTALQDLFPNISFDKSKWRGNKSLWHKPDKRRAVFEDYAMENGFDPENPESWYRLAKGRRIMSFKGVLGVLSYHNLSIPQALMDLFPNIGLDKAKFG